MFNRNDYPSRPPPPQSSYPPQGYPQQQGRPPPPPQQQYHDKMGYPQQSHSQSQRPPSSRQSRSLMLHPTKSPDNTYTFRNLVAVSPHDIPPSRDGTDPYVLVNENFVFTARPYQGFPQGQIGMNDPQRTWAQIALTDSVSVQLYDPFASGGDTYVGALDLEVAFAGRKTTEAPYDQDELAENLAYTFQSQILSPGQQFLMDHRSIPLRITVKTVQLASLSMSEKPGAASQQPVRSDPQAHGILTTNSQMNFLRDQRSPVPVNLKASKRRPAANAIVQPNFKFEDMGIGGLDTEFSTIFRRAFASRIFPPGLVERMNIQHVKGILLFGPPGTGKTLIARQIGKMLNAREPKVINGPEVLNKFVGQSEENIRKLFADAEKEYKEKGDESGLHIIIFDELDAVCKQRGSGAAGGTGVGDSVVNQLLSKLDGVDQLNNILLIGMTNRKDMIDDALLRPGRLELHIEISLPDETGRVQILKIHTEKMRQNGVIDYDVDVTEIATLTKNFSGAELSGLVRAASSFAFNRHIKVGTMASVSDDVENLKINRADFMNALTEVHSAFGVSEEDLERCLEGDVLPFSPNIGQILSEGARHVQRIRSDPHASVLSVLLHGPSGSGKTALAAKMALDSEFPFIKLVSPRDIINFSEAGKKDFIGKVFQDAYKSSLSIVVLDSFESIIEWNPIGPRFSNTVFGALKTLLEAKPPKERRLLVLVTTSRRSVMDQLDVLDAFNHEIAVPNVSSLQELYDVLKQTSAFGGESSARKQACGMVGEVSGDRVGVGIKKVLDAVSSSKQSDSAEEQVRDFVEKIGAMIARGGET
ncbi:MAG: hypothetical protein Q9162_004506 [Coniocarpon cinnabarinum]